jgi:anti-sigma regulatory factor (Ser/Thr protein kinase)
VEDLSLHILDISENSIEAGATEIEIIVREDTRRNRLVLEIKDNGKGLDKETRQKALDPFYTTKTTRRVGLGLPLLAQAAKEADGELTIESQQGKGTIITAEFVNDHIDRKPLGNIAETLVSLITAKGPGIEIIYRHQKNDDSFSLDTREIKKELQEVPINNPGVLLYLRNTIKNSLKELEEE